MAQGNEQHSKELMKCNYYQMLTSVIIISVMMTVKWSIYFTLDDKGKLSAQAITGKRAVQSD